jgi:hypothetical protein
LASAWSRLQAVYLCEWMRSKSGATERLPFGNQSWPDSPITIRTKKPGGPAHVSSVRIAAALGSLKGHDKIRRQPNFTNRDFFVFQTLKKE